MEPGEIESPSEMQDQAASTCVSRRFILVPRPKTGTVLWDQPDKSHRIGYRHANRASLICDGFKPLQAPPLETSYLISQAARRRVFSSASKKVVLFLTWFSRHPRHAVPSFQQNVETLSAPNTYQTFSVHPLLANFRSTRPTIPHACSAHWPNTPM